MADRVWPMRAGSYTLTSGFGPRWGAHHSGLDFGAPDGTPFYACADGVVTHIGPASGYGQWIVIDHPASVGGGCTEYGHMWNAFATGLSVGSRVTKGQLIGYVGSNGQSTGPHLHLTVWERGYGGKRIDPEVWLDGHPHAGDTDTAAPADRSGTLYGVDVSEHQDGMSLTRAGKESGIDFAILRLCDGTYRDRTFRSHLADAEAGGLLVSTYWYLRAPSEGTSIAQQVDVIDAQMASRRDLGVWIDVESVSPGGAKLLTGADVREAKYELESRGYYVPGIYTGRWYWEHMPGGEPSMDGLGHLWVSDYGTTDRVGSPQAIYSASGGDGHRGWSYPLGDRKPDLLQIGSRGIAGGYQPVDINVFRGTRAELARLFHPRSTIEEVAMTLLSGVSAAALDEARRDSKLTVEILEAPIASLINGDKAFKAKTLLALIDRATWETATLVEALFYALGLDPKAIIDAAVTADNEGRSVDEAVRHALNLREV